MFLLPSSTCVAGGHAGAQEALDLGVVRIGSEQAQNALGNIEISREQIEARNPWSLGEVFDGESEITSSGGAPIAQKVFVNGIEESLLSVTIDGARADPETPVRARPSSRRR